MLAHKIDDTWVIWRKRTRVNGMWPPTNAETALDDEQLAALGLFRVTRQAVPEGQFATAWTLSDVGGLPVEVPTLIDVPPPPTPAELALRFNELQDRTDLTALALRAIVSLLADRMGITDAAAKTAVKNRMQAIAEGTRG